MTLGDIRRAAYTAAMDAADKDKLLVAEGLNAVAGIRIPFALEYLLNCNVLPLGVMIELLGEAGSNKTTLAYEFGRMIYSYEGWTEMFLTEGKISPDLISSIMGYVDECKAAGKEAPFMCFKSDSMEEWQRMTMERVGMALKLFSEGSTKHGSPKGAYQPIQYVVDSIMGQNLADTDSNVSSDGATGRRFAVEAGSLTTYLKAVQREIAKGPFLLTLINHAKPIPPATQYMKTTYNSPGGKQVRFQATYRILLHKRSKQIKVEDESTSSLLYKGYSVELELLKSSLGEDTNKITVPYYWRYLPCELTGRNRQRGTFGWNEALVGVLNQQIHSNSDLTGGAKAKALVKLDAVVHYRHSRGDAYTSKTFGATDASPLTARQLGAKIQSEPEMIEGLRDLFGIKRYHVWDNATNFFQLQNTLTAQLTAKNVNIPTATVKGKS